MNKEINSIFIGASGFIGRYITAPFPQNKIIKTYHNNYIENGVKINLENINFKSFFDNYPNTNKVFILCGLTNFNSIIANPKLAFSINVTLIKNLLKEIHSRNIKPIFFSSESVFDGINGDYVETDSPKPTFEYGYFKKEIEDYIIKTFNDFLIFRLSKVFDSDFKNNTLVTSWINKILLSEDIYCANDNYFSPIHVYDLIEFILKVVNNDESNGIYHLSSNEYLSRKEMLEILINQLPYNFNMKSDIFYQSLHDFPIASSQPLNTTLNSSKVIKFCNFQPSNFKFWINHILNQKYYNNFFEID